MNRESLEEIAFQRTTLDADVIESLSYEQLRELLHMRPTDPIDPAKPRKQRPIKPRAVAIKLDRVDFVESRSGKLVRRETYTDGSIVYVRCGERVQFEGRTVSASIVLHWVRTGERVTRAPRAVKPFRAVVREGDKVKHLGRFATREERDAAVIMYRLGKSPSN